MKLSKLKSVRRSQIALFFVAFSFLALNPYLALAEKEKPSWGGTYLQESGPQVLYLEHYDNLLSIDIVAAGHSKDNLAEGSHFVARINGNIATFDDHEGCKTQLIRKPEGIEIKDYCGGAQRDNGLYRKAP